MWVAVVWVKPMNSRPATLLATEGMFGTEVGMFAAIDGLEYGRYQSTSWKEVEWLLEKNICR